MAKPVPGREYTVEKGDTLSHISLAAYGDGTKWRRIYKANQSRLRSDDPDDIYPGEVIIIPGQEPEIEAIERELAAGSLAGKDPDAFTLIVDGAEIPVKAARIIRSIDQAVDGWTATLARNFDDATQNDKLRPYGYKSASVYLGGQLLINGKLYTVSPSVSNSGSVLELEGWSAAADIVDSTVKPPYEQKKITLEKRAKDLCDPLGFPIHFEVDDDEPFDRVTVGPTEKILEHLAKLASQRGVLINSNEQGDLIFVRANVDAKPVGSLTEGLPPLASLAATFDGRARYNVYRAIAKTPKKKALVGIAKDTVVPISRFMTFEAPDATEGNIQQTADWRRSKQLAETLAIPVPVSSWYAPDGTLWRENTIVTLISPSLFVPEGFNFLIKSVEYVFEESGTTATLNLVPPQVYTGGELVEPWV